MSLLRSGLTAVCVTSNAPWVRARAAPPRAGTAYSWSQPVFSQGKTSSPRGVHSRLRSESVGANTLPAPWSATHSALPAPVSGSAVQIDQGRPLRREMKAPVLSAGRRMKARRLPSGANSGAVS